VWREIEKLFPIKTITYGDLARRIGSAARAVGGACGTNPVPLFVPCHRVLAASGGLGGFMGGKDDFPLSVKRWLLRHEGLLDTTH
jgi:methylated-DNA-[protein]-cysteine S-methyltransferase